MKLDNLQIRSFNYKIKRKNFIMKNKENKQKIQHNTLNILEFLCQEDKSIIIQHLLSFNKYKVYMKNTNSYLINACASNSIKTLQVFVDKNIGLNDLKFISELENHFVTQGTLYFLKAISKKNLLCNIKLKDRKTKSKL